MVTRLQLQCLAAAAMLLLLLCLAASGGYGVEPEYVPDQVLVKFCPGTPASEIARAHASAGSAVRDEIEQLGVQIVGLPPGLTVGRALGLYEHNPNVEFVEPDYYVEPVLTPNDPYFKYGQLQLQWMGGPQAWDITMGSPSVLIAVLDTGVDFTHPDLQGRLVAGWDFVQDDADPSDENGHGTSVTGVLGSATNNGYGTAGVSWRNPVLCVRIGDYAGWTTSSRMAQGITYAATQGARVINISFAGTAYPSSVASAVLYAWEKGAVTVAGAGNSADSVAYYPAALPNAIAVSGVDGNDTIVSYSNYGPWVDVCAPCHSQTTVMGGTIGLVGGTSIAAPFVTGLFGLVFSVNPSLSPEQAVAIVCGTATDLGTPGFDDYYGWGKIDLYGAVLAASQIAPVPDTAPPTVSIVSPTAGEVVSGVATVSANATDNVAVERVEVYLDGGLVASAATAPYTWEWDTSQAADGPHTVSARAYDASGNRSDANGVSVEVQNTPEATSVTEVFTGGVGFSRRGGSQNHAFTAQGAGAIAASVSWGGKADLDLYLYSPAGALMAAATTRNASGSERLECQAAQAGLYTCRVVAASGKASYTLAVTHP